MTIRINDKQDPTPLHNELKKFLKIETVNKLLLLNDRMQNLTTITYISLYLIWHTESCLLLLNHTMS